jgi:hypothetical protein
MTGTGTSYASNISGANVQSSVDNIGTQQIDIALTNGSINRISAQGTIFNQLNSPLLVDNVNYNIIDFSTRGLGKNIYYFSSPLRSSLSINNQATTGLIYQSYGMWLTGVGNNSSTTNAYSVGSRTPIGSVPTSGSASFSGESFGSAIDSASFQVYDVSSTVNLTVNFSNNTVQYQSTGTVGITSGTNLRVDNLSALNSSGILTWQAGSNLFVGNLTALNGWSGVARGQFYGPSANEAGGTFYLLGPSFSAYVGAFGVKR